MSAYSDAVNALGPVAYWRLGEASGVTAYDETTNHDGTYINTPTLGENSLIVSDPGNKAVLFASAQSERVSVPHHANLMLGASFSIVAWVKFTSTSTWTSILGKYAAGPAKGFMLMVNFGGDNKARIWTKNVASSAVVGTTVLNDGNAHMIVATLASGTGKIYVDGGAAENSGALQTPGANTAVLEIADTDSRKYNGTEDEGAVFDYELSQAQIQALYDVATTVEEATTVYECGNCTVTFYYNPSTMLLLRAECSGLPENCQISFKASEYEGDTWEDEFTEAGSKDCPYEMHYTEGGEGGLAGITVTVQMGKA